MILDSHDSPRFSVIAGSRERQLVGVGLQMTTPGVPMVFAGDEIGLGGDWGEDARRTMPWSRPESWDTQALEGYRALIALRRGSRALARGGIRYAHVSADAIAYVREARGDAVLCLASRAAHDPVRLPLGRLAAGRSTRSSVRTFRSTMTTPCSRLTGRRSMPGDSCDDEGGPTWLKCSSKRWTRSTREASTPSRISHSMLRTASFSSSSGLRAAARRPHCA